MKLGNFSPDLFGPVEDFALVHLKPEQRQGLRDFGLRNAQARAAAIFLHFDNLEGKLDRNSKFDYLLNQLLENTRGALAADHARADLGDATRNILILVTLGANRRGYQIPSQRSCRAVDNAGCCWQMMGACLVRLGRVC
jgi:hypothetical protein